MNQLKLSVGVLLLGSVALATNFAACKSSGGGATGSAGASGTAGSGTAGSGTAGSGTAGGESATLPDGGCVSGAYPHSGVCSCQSDVPTVCEETCVDTTTDDGNCGTCGKTCAATSTCNVSACGPEAVNVLPAIAGCALPSTDTVDAPMNITVNSGKIYYTDFTHGTVASVPVGGGTATPIVSGEMHPGLIAVTGTTVLWISVTPGATVTSDAGVPTTTTTATIRKAALPSGPASTLVSETNTNGGILGFVLSPDGSTVYYSADVNVKSIALSAASGTAGTIVAMEQANGVPAALGITPDGKTLGYMTVINGDVDIVTLGTSAASTNGNNCPANTACCGLHDPANSENYLMSNCTRIARSQGSPYYGSLIFNGMYAYWANDESIYVNPYAPGSGQNNQQVGTTNGATITALAGSATNIYIGNGRDNVLQKGIYSLPPDGGMNPDPIAVSRAQKAPSSIAFDSTNVYWSTADCAINSLKQ